MTPGSARTAVTGPPLIDGFRAFAPSLAPDNTGFRVEYFEELARLEADNFWFRARNDLIVWALAAVPSRTARSFLEIGCGTGFVLRGIHDADPSTELSGSEIFSAGLAFAAARVPSASFSRWMPGAIPFRDEFDVIGAFDVLEHIEDDDDGPGRGRQGGASGRRVSWRPCRSIRRSGACRTSTPTMSGATRRAVCGARWRRPASRSSG